MPRDSGCLVWMAFSSLAAVFKLWLIKSQFKYSAPLAHSWLATGIPLHVVGQRNRLPVCQNLPESSQAATICWSGFFFLAPRRRSGERTEERSNPQTLSTTASDRKSTRL